MSTKNSDEEQTQQSTTDCRQKTWKIVTNNLLSLCSSSEVQYLIKYLRWGTKSTINNWLSTKDLKDCNKQSSKSLFLIWGTIPHQVPQMRNRVNNQMLIVAKKHERLFITIFQVFVPHLRYNTLSSTSDEEQTQQSASDCHPRTLKIVLKSL